MRLPGVNVAFQPPAEQDLLAKKSSQPLPSKDFKSCAHLIWGFIGCNPYTIKDTAPKFDLSGKTPTGRRN
jgi:hypothetical protein